MGNFSVADYLKVFGLLIIGLVAIVYRFPMHTPCRSQTEIYTDGIHPLIKSYNKNLQLCKEHTDPGGCLPLFEILGKFDGKLKELGNQCQQDLDEDKNTSGILSQSMELMVRAAWGTKPPDSYVYKNGWLNNATVELYCKFKQYYIHIYGSEAEDAFINKILLDLPGADKMDRGEVWNRCLLSDPCKYSL